jgi:hypothetical protein
MTGDHEYYVGVGRRIEAAGELGLRVLRKSEWRLPTAAARSISPVSNDITGSPARGRPGLRQGAGGPGPGPSGGADGATAGRRARRRSIRG